MVTLVVAPRDVAASGVETVVEDDRYRHLFRARRMAIGDRVRLVDGSGVARHGEVVRIERRRAWIRSGETMSVEEPRCRLELLVAPPKPERAGWLVEKATELGVAAVRFVSTERAPREYGDAVIGRLRRIAVAALEQSHGAVLPEVTGVDAWPTVSGRVAACDRAFVLQPGHPDLASRTTASAVALLIGPEGGWTADELCELAAAGASPVGLGHRILRVETAAVAGASLLLARG